MHQRGVKISLQIGKTKTCCADLAVFGGPPTFETALHVNRPAVGSRHAFDRYVDSAWDRKWFTNNGPLVNQLETELEQFLGVSNCVLMSSGTSALSVLIAALGLQGEVILPSFTFVSSAHALHLAGITPVFCDVDPGSGNLDIHHARRLVTRRTTAILATHLWGHPCETGALSELAAAHDLHLIFDAAHAFGCAHQGKMIGNFGDAEVFSFHATKAFHTNEGGAVTCADDGLAEQLRAMRSFGFTGMDRVDFVGTNAKLSEISAAMGLVNLHAFEANTATSREVYHTYRDRLASFDQLSLMQHDESQLNNYHYVALRLAPTCKISRDVLIEVLHAEAVLARKYYHPGCHMMEPYRTLFPEAGQNLPRTKELTESTVVLPGGAGMSVPAAERVCDLLAFILQNAGEISWRLERV